MAEKDNSWSITLSGFQSGYSPLAFDDSLTEEGSGGHASTMQNVNVLNGKLTQGPGLSNLTGTVDESIQFILDKATSDNVGWAFGTTKLFKISATAVLSSSGVSGCTDGESLLALKGNLYGFYNKTSGGDIFKMPLTTETIESAWGSTSPTGSAALQNAIHPSAGVEDIALFGNGQYAGTYIVETNTLAPTKLDFGTGNVVADVVYSGGYFYIAVNEGVSGANRSEGRVFLYGGSATLSTLDDETGVGVSKIGFLYRLNSIIYVAYKDISFDDGFSIGYILGRQIKPLTHLPGSLPTFAQKTLFKGVILALSDGLVYAAGAMVDTLPFAGSQIADGGYATASAIGAPFGVPLVASTDGGSNYRLAKFSGFETAANWQSIVFPVIVGRFKGLITSIVVLTNTLASGASCALTIQADQDSSTSSTMTITTTGKRRHVFTAIGLGQIEDFMVKLDFSGGSSSNNVVIRKVIINGNYVEN